MKNNYLWNKLKAHYGHNVCIALYGDKSDPADICLECEDCGEVIVNAGLYELCAKNYTEKQ